nr:circadian clock protein KaiC [Gemmatimonadaceae bacterium]
MIVHPPESDLVLPKHATGITGFDFIAQGGLPKGRTTLVAGTAGSAKTVFAAQFLAEGIKQHGEAGVFVTFEEAALDIRRNMRSLHWPIEQWEADGRWAFVDASPVPADAGPVIGEFDLGGLLARIENAVRRTGARRVSMDSVATIFARFEDHATVRSELLRITQALKTMGVTSIITAERTQEYGDIARFGVEEFVTDNVIILRNVLEVERRRRTIEILKFRGAPHGKGEYPFTIIPGDGLVVIPLSAIELQQHSSDVRITSGNVELDRMCGGGFFRDSVILVSGATGCGKTLMTAEFLNGGVQNGERCLVFAFEESREQLIRNARGWNVDFERAEQSGLLRLSCEYPEVMGLEDHLIRLKAEIEAFGPQRIAVD